MEFNKYKERAITTKLYKPEMGVYYNALGLCGESGEVAEKIKKIIRDKNGIINEEDKKEISKELGDVLWYIAAMCDTLNLDFNKVAVENIEKLEKRKRGDVLRGSGDNR